MISDAMYEEGCKRIAALEAQLAAATAERDNLILQAQWWACEAKAQRATVNESYQAITGATGEPGDWHGAEPIKAVVAERDTLRHALTQAVEALDEQVCECFDEYGRGFKGKCSRCKALAHAQEVLECP